MTAARTKRPRDLVPLPERQVYLRVLRAVLAAIVVIDAALLPHLLRRSFAFIASIAVLYVLVSWALEAIGRLGVQRKRWLFTTVMMIDGVYLASATYLTGGSGGPVRYLIFVYLAAVTLLGSWRSGLKLALWQSLLQWVVYYGQHTKVLAGFPNGSTAHNAWLGVIAFTLALAALTAATATLAAVNERELRRGRYELEQLARMGRDLEDASEPLSVGDVLLDALTETFGFRRMALFEVVDDEPRMLTARGLLDARVADFSLGDRSVLRIASERRETLFVEAIDPAVDPWLAAIMPGAYNVTVIPLIADRVVGVLVTEMGEQSGVATDGRVIATMERYAGHTALAIRNANLLARVQQMAVTDGLTELANRRAFDRSLDRELSRAARTDGRLSIVLLDIDHFKLLNDNHGHVVGDTVLKQIAQALQRCGREYDTIARYGGEEFAAVLPGCSSGLAVQVAERLRRAVQDAPSDVQVTASAGVATYPYDGIDVAGLLNAADQALYASKRAGRNQVRSAEQARAEITTRVSAN